MKRTNPKRTGQGAKGGASDVSDISRTGASGNAYTAKTTNTNHINEASAVNANRKRGRNRAASKRKGSQSATSKALHNCRKRQRERQGKKLDYKVLASGSSGNCVIIERTMVDCGVSYRLAEPYLKDVDTLLITHCHTDHLRKSTLERIRKSRPSITVVANADVASKAKVDFICKPGETIAINGIAYLPFQAIHDVPACGYTWQVDGKDIIYVTDTSSFENAPEKKYDYLFLESNHDEKKLAMAKGKIKKYGYNAYKSGKRHASTQKCKAFYYTHRKSKSSPLIELHKSNRFY